MVRLASMLCVPALLSSSVLAQQNCPLPPAIQPLSHDSNIFSDQQEVDLGDAMAESLARRIRVIDDDQLNAHLRVVGDRLVQHLPPSQLKFRFYLVELGEVNAFSIAGGRVYVARKMVAFTKNDDELAGVLAHELGHIVTHQTAIGITALLRSVLGVTQVGDRADIFEKFHLLMEKGNEGGKSGRSGEEESQYVADQVALYAMARSGYSPHAFVEFWDRFQETHGKTGSWLSNLFGTTKPSERRLAVMLRNFSALPPGCADIAPGSSAAEFAKWQSAVVDYSGLGTKELVPGLVSKQTLARPLRPDITNLHFSPDGKYVLAQDDGGIHVLTREPLSVLFYIPAIDVYPAHFTPDSRSIVFYSRSLRVESWSIADQRRTSAHELAVLHGCVQSELSPDGLKLGCLDSEFTLLVLDVESGSVQVSKKEFTRMNPTTACTYAASLASGASPRFIGMGFSPDSRYFLAGAYLNHFAWDLAGQREFPLPGSIKAILQESFTFLGADRITGIDTASPTKSPVLRFPTGERLQQIHLAVGIELTGATRGDYFFVSPLKNSPMGLVDIKKGSLTVEFKRRAADIYDETMVTEQVTGELAFHAVANLATSTPPLAKIKLPEGRLGALRAAAVSPDFNWIAISHGTRGAVWDVKRNIRTMELASFHGAWFAPDQFLYVDLAKFGDSDRTMARLNPVTGDGTLGYKIGDALAEQTGSYLLVAKPRAPSQSNGKAVFISQYFCFEVVMRNLFANRSIAKDEDVELLDARDGHQVWSRYFPHEVPEFSIGAKNLILSWRLNTPGGREELSKFPELKNSTSDTDYLLEEIDLQSDTVTAKLIINTNKGSFKVESVNRQGDWIAFTASGNQVIIYSLSAGQEKGHFFGSHPMMSTNGLIAIENQLGEISIYDLVTSQLKQEYRFSDPVSFKRFSPDGGQMFVMTASQTAYVLDIAQK